MVITVHLSILIKEKVKSRMRFFSLVTYVKNNLVHAIPSFLIPVREIDPIHEKDPS
jgi:hypothetical protein